MRVEEVSSVRAVYIRGTCTYICYKHIQRYMCVHICIYMQLFEPPHKCGPHLCCMLQYTQDSTFLSTISISVYIDNISLHRAHAQATSHYCRPRVMTMLSHAAKLRSVLESAGVDIVLPLQEFKYNLMG